MDGPNAAASVTATLLAAAATIVFGRRRHSCESCRKDGHRRCRSGWAIPSAHQQETWLLHRHHSAGLAMAWLSLVVGLLISSSAVAVMLLTVTRLAWREQPLNLTGSLLAACTGTITGCLSIAAVGLGQRSLGLMREQRRELQANLRLTRGLALLEQVQDPQIRDRAIEQVTLELIRNGPSSGRMTP